MNRHHSSLIAIAAAAAMAAYLFLVFLPTRQSIAGLNAELQAQRDLVAETSQLLASMGEIQEELDEARLFVQQWRPTARNSQALTELLGRVTSAAVSAGVKLQRLTPRPSSPRESLTMHPLEVEFRGPFAAAFEFLRKLEEMPEVVWVTHCQLECEAGKDMRCLVKFTAFTSKSKNSG